MAEGDLLIAVGVRFDDRHRKDRHLARTLTSSIRIDPANIGKNVAPTLSITADAATALTAVHAEVNKRGEQGISIDRRAP